jgi:hypothetical protein
MHADIGRCATPGEWTRIQPTPVQGVSLLRAHFVNHSFERHSHGEFCIGMTASGRQTFRSRGALHTSTRGRIVVFNPDQAHDGHAGDAQGFGYTMLYLQPEVVAAGFADQSHFSRRFKGSVGVTPRAWLRQMKVAPPCRS